MQTSETLEKAKAKKEEGPQILALLHWISFLPQRRIPVSPTAATLCCGFSGTCTRKWRKVKGKGGHQAREVASFSVGLGTCILSGEGKEHLSLPS